MAATTKVLALVTVSVLGGLGWLAYERITAIDPSAPPLIRADDGPIKIRPKDPGGMAVPDQDKLIYQTLDGGVVEETVERLLPPPEEPLPPPEPPAPEITEEAPAAAGRRHGSLYGAARLVPFHRRRRHGVAPGGQEKRRSSQRPFRPGGARRPRRRQRDLLPASRRPLRQGRTSQGPMRQAQGAQRRLHRGAAMRRRCLSVALSTLLINYKL